MPDSESDLEILLLAFLAGRLAEDDDPFFADVLFERLRRRWSRSERRDPEIEQLLMHSLRRGPRYVRERRLSESREVAVSVLEGYRRSMEENLERRFVEFGLRASSAQSVADTATASAERTSQGLLQVTDELHTYLWMAAVGADVAAARITRYIPVRVYVADPVPDAEALESIVASLAAVAEQAGLERAEELPEETGSWWKRLALRTKDVASQKEVAERLEKIERALELQYLDKPQAEANEAQARAAAGLIAALESTASACIQVGTLLVVKITDGNGQSSIVTRTLTIKELKRIEENKDVLRRPNEILNWLDGRGPKALAPGVRGDASS